MTAPWIAIGRVRSANPAAREVRVEMRPGCNRAFPGMAWIRFERPAQAPLRCKVESVRVDGAVAVVRMGPGVPRDAVGVLRGANVVVMPEEMPGRSAEAWVLDDLVGLEVVLPDGALLGTICEVYEGPANDALAVARPDGSRCVLPVIDAVVRLVDFDARRVDVGDVAPYIVDA
jgi:16S rRNA processing protein RimM